jgi:hydroxyacylglutathione hydrolase
MFIKRLEIGALAANCYIIADEDTKIAAVIDPGGDGVAALCTHEGLQVKYIINTHGHADHIMGNAELKAITAAELLVHAADAEMVTSSTESLATFVGLHANLVPPDRMLADGEELSLGSLVLKIVHTPGHTPGGISIAVGGCLFTGDTLFAESIGRTDFPGGSFNQLMQSVKAKLFMFPDETVVYPGHGPKTTIGWEKEHNPYLS